MKLKGKSIVISGASEGLGLEIAATCLKEGANIFICSRSDTKLKKALVYLNKFKKDKQKLFDYKLDVSNPNQCDIFVNHVMKEFKIIDALINNAGIIGPKNVFDSCDWNSWKYAIDVNLFGSAYLIYKFLPYMKKRKKGSIIQLSGGGATKPFPNMSAYAASKAAIVRFIETLAVELMPYDITANCVAPGALNTQILDEFISAGPKALGEKFYEGVLKQKETGGAPMHKAVQLCIELISGNSSMITGKLISAIWDDWWNFNEFAEELKNSDVYTIRRITAKDRNYSWGDL